MTGREEPNERRDAGAWLRRAASGAALLAAGMLLTVAGIAWTAYFRGRPVDLLGVGVTAPGTGPPLPVGAVIAIQGDSCPRPWREFLPAQGRFVLGAGAGGAMNLDADGMLVPVRKAGDTGGQAGVELLVTDMPPHTHRLAIAEVPAGHGDMVAFGVESGAAERLGVLMPFAMKTSMTVPTRRFTVLAPLETVGGVITSDRRYAARRHDNVPPFVALTFCTYAPREPIAVAGTGE